MAIARNIHNILLGSNKVDAKDMFSCGRTAYVFDITDDSSEFSIPITLVRSKYQVPPLEKNNLKSVSEVVLQKLTHILSYIRQDGKGSKLDSIKSKKTFTSKPVDNLSIYDEDVGVYDPQESLKRYHEEKSKEKQAPYFETEKVVHASRSNTLMEPSGTATATENLKGLIDSVLETVPKNSRGLGRTNVLEKKLETLTAANESYVECYPSVGENMLSVIDSDEDADFTKQDTKIKKPLINSCDFATEEEYKKYLETKKQVQKGVRKANTKQPERQNKKNKKIAKDKNKLNKEWEKISHMISERKSHNQFDETAQTPFKKKKM